MTSVFISYRREESAGYSGRLYDHLCAEFGKHHVFMDIEALEPGADFVAAIDKEIAACDVLLVVIGTKWLSVTDEHGRRLDNPNDFIHIEINSGLRREMRIIPVLVDGASMPRGEDLPQDIAPFARRHALELSNSRWEFDVARLVNTLKTSRKTDTIVKDIKERAAVSGYANREVRSQGKVREQTPAAALTQAIPQSGPVSTKRIRGLLISVFLAGLVTLLVIGYWNMRPFPSTELEGMASLPSHLEESTKTDASSEPAAPRSSPDSNSVSTLPKPETSDKLNKQDTSTTLIPPDNAPVDSLATIESTQWVDRQIDLAPVPSDAEKQPPKADWSRIKQLLALAATDLTEYRLTSPPGNNALERYEEVLKIVPQYWEAVQGIENIAKQYLALVRGALENDDLEKVDTYLDRAQTLAPELASLDDMRIEVSSVRRRIKRQENAQRALEEAQHDQQEAARLAREKAEREQEEVRRAQEQALREREIAKHARKVYEACLGDCEREFESCQAAEQQSGSVESCEATALAQCDAEHKRCISDPQRLFLGKIATNSECAGEYEQCRNQVTTLCTEQQQRTLPNACKSQLVSCQSPCPQQP